MSFIVIARAPGREVTFERGSMLAALEQALRLSASGMTAVRVIDSQGRVHSAADLSRLLQTRPASDSLAA